jgi:hypothetical protein
MGGGKIGMFMVEKDHLFFNSTPKWQRSSVCNSSSTFSTLAWYCLSIFLPRELKNSSFRSIPGKFWIDLKTLRCNGETYVHLLGST